MHQAPPVSPSAVKKPGKAFLIISIAIMVLGPIASLIAMAAMISNGVDNAQVITPNIPAAAALDSNSDYIIFSQDTLSCSIADPAGSPVSQQETSPGVGTYITKFSTEAAGPYTILCPASDYASIFLLRGGAIGNFIAAGVLVIACFALFFVGLVLTIIAAVLLAKRSKRYKAAKAAEEAAQMAAAYPPAYGPGGQPQYGPGQPYAPGGQPQYSQPPSYGGGQPPSYGPPQPGPGEPPPVA
ncbi:MAG: hypothetical protein LBI84_01530 [Propionibacteriaceae bacterium]|jgi:hypothetical protein|nr:hypothetical protein [Propionibacteriaceae bacterium]